MDKAHDPFDIIIFGGTGDLALRKLLPGLYHNDCAGLLPEDGRIIGSGRSALGRDEYADRVESGCREFIDDAHFDEGAWERFAPRLDYVSIDVTEPRQLCTLADVLHGRDEHVRVFYLATAPDLFAPACEAIAQAGLVTPASRVVLEKPIGVDLESARSINARVAAVFAEHQVYRIDHYLGKEAVQNVLSLRFGNAVFEPVWKRGHVRNVAITVAETLGVGSRAGYYDRSGALRDMLQNHLLQVLCLVAMEPPSSMEPDAMRDEKMKVLRSLRPVDDGASSVVRGQYVDGSINGHAVPGYLDEPGVPAGSRTETFVGVRAFVDNWRWAGVPFLMRTGKRLPERVSEVVINFDDAPHRIYDGDSSSGRNSDNGGANRLVIRLQPDESVRLHLLAKAPREDHRLRPVYLDLDFAETFDGRRPDAYEALLIDVLQGKPTLFMRRDEVEAAWRWVAPILKAWDADRAAPAPYAAGTWGPPGAGALGFDTRAR